MSAYKQQEFDFICRTKEIIVQYENFNHDPDVKYEVTLLLNCLIGLVILPQQHWFDTLPNDLINKQDWGISGEEILFIKEGEISSVANIARHLRNSVSHYNFLVFENSKNDIDNITFKDYTDHSKNNRTFECNLSISSLKIFANKFSDYLLKIMNEK